MDGTAIIRSITGVNNGGFCEVKTMINITLPDNSIKKIEAGTTILQLAHKISSSLGKKTCGALVDGQLVDLRFALENDCQVQIVLLGEEASLPVLRHSFSHILAAAISNLYPDAQFGVGPAISEGFYYDVDIKPQISNDDLAKISREMSKIIEAGLVISKQIVSHQEALTLFAGDVYKQEIIQGLPSDSTISTYTIGEKYVDLCKGPHLQKTSHGRFFKLTSLAGSYWKGDVNNPQLQRIYGTAFFTKEDLAAHLAMIEERKERDHRKLGKEQKIFMNHLLAGQGCPLWLPNGFAIRKVLENYFYQKELEYGHQHVITPVLGDIELYKTSGHWANYQENMFPVMERNGEQLVLRPMTCPHHMLIYKNQLRSYKDLPLRLAENALLHRYEASGALAGLERVRAMCLTDTHIFVAPSQIKGEMKHLWKLIKEVIAKLDLKIHYVELALRGPKGKYHQNDQLWDKSEALMKEVLAELQVEYTPMKGEAAFYGPKIDLQVKTAIGHVITLATLQLDFLLPERFDLTFIAQDGSKKRPVVIHRGLVGTYERLMAILLEQYKGAFPVWLAPVQVIILPVSSQHHHQYSNEIMKHLGQYDIRCQIDERNQRLSYRVREAHQHKIPFQIIVGDTEQKEQTLKIREYQKEGEKVLKISQFIKYLKEISH